MSEESKGIREGVESSQGDPRLILLLNAVLSAWFAYTALWGLDKLGVVPLSMTNLATFAIIVFALTYVVVLR